MAINLSGMVKPVIWRLAFITAASFGLLACTAPPPEPPPTFTAARPTAPAPTATAVPPTATIPPTPPPTPAPGTVSGSVCYPGSQNPPMTLYLQNTAGGDPAKLDIPRNQPGYTLQVPAGEYTAYALTVGTELAGAYTECTSDAAACTGHQPLPFTVQGGQTTENINLCDWYNPPGLISAGPDATAGEAVTVTTVQKMNVFAGPGLAFDTRGFAPSRASAPALGRNADSSWLQIPYPAAEGSAWIYAPLTLVSGRSDSLPLTSPETNPAPLGREPSTTQFSPGVWSASFNEGVVHFIGSITDEQSQPVNGFSILADNGTWSVLSHPTGASHWYPDLKDGQWDIIITNATDAAGWWTLTVVSYDCPDFDGGFNAQCKQFTRLSETQLVKIVYPDENVIHADWVCHHDCDKGLYLKAYRP